MNHPFSIDNLPTCIPFLKAPSFYWTSAGMNNPSLFRLIELGAFRSVDHAVDTPSSLILENQTIFMAEFSHCACANVILLGRVAKRCQHYPTTSNNTQHFWPKSNFAQHHPTIPNITQQCPTWVAKRSQHLYPTLLAFVGQKCWHRLARALF